VEKIGQIWSLRVRENEFRDFKTPVTERDVPIHPTLLKLGILQLAEGRPSKELLFPDVPTGAGSRFNAAQKRLARLIRKNVTPDPKVVFHSTRHSFRDETRNCGIPREMITRLGGWSGSGAAMDDYGDGYSLTQLKAGLAKVKYGNVSFE
jgi:integrase